MKVHRRTLRRRADRGNALLIAVMVTSVCLGMSLVGVQLALSSSRSSGLDRQRVLAIHAAEAGIDSGYTAIQAAGILLPCSASSGDVHSAPDIASYSTTLTYYDAAGVKLICPLAVGAVAAQAVIRSTATTNTLGGSGSRPTRTMEALVNLTQQGGVAAPLDKAIFAGGALFISSSLTATGSSGANAHLYSNNNIACNSSSNIAGDLTSQGDVTTMLNCIVGGNVWAKGLVSLGSGNSVAGFVKADTGTIAANLINTTISGNLYAGGAINFPGCASAGKCFQNSPPGSPPAVTFPQILSDDASIAKWTALVPGYTLVDDNINCGTIGTRIRDTYATRLTPTLVRTTCAVSIPFSYTIALSSDLAIFAKGGISFNSSDKVTSSSSLTRKLHLIVPYDVATPQCTSPTVTGQSSFTATSAVQIFIYSPCDIGWSSSSAMSGQIYGGSKVTIQSAFTFNYQPMQAYGMSGSAPAGYGTSIVYKRETT